MKVLARAREAAAVEQPLGPAWFVVGAVILVVATAGSAAVPETTSARWFLAVCTAAALVFVCLRSTRQGIVVTLLWLFALGASRRLASEVLADPGRDPFVLVGSAAATVLAARAVLAGAWQRCTPLAWAVLVFTALAVLQIANPDQSDDFGRVAGLLVWVVPLLWFWVGRTLLDGDLARRVILLVAGATTVAALYGILQSTLDFPPWDERWIEHRGYAALFVGPETVRPFGSYASAAEFALACAVGAVIAATAVFARRRLASGPRDGGRRVPHRLRTRIVVIGVAVFCVNVFALLLSAIRTYVVLLVIALPIVYVVVHGRRAWKVVGLACVCAAIAFAVLAQVNPDSIGRTGPEASIRRILVAVNDPFTSNEENTDNTLELHYDNVKRGLTATFSDPLGRGTGSTGIAGGQFGGTSTSTDVDVVDAGIAFGLVGLVLALGIVVLGIGTGLRAALATRRFEDAALVGILVVSLGAWFQGAHYAMAPVLWLLLGRADGARARAPTRGATAQEPTVEASSIR